PGSPLAIGTFLAWGWILGSATSWTAAAIAVLLAAAGWAAAAVLTGRTLKRRRVPGRSMAVAMAAGVVGLFVIPFFGLFIGFAAGLLLSEYARRRDLRAALDASLESLKAMGIGILIEFAMVCLASSVWTVGVAAHFATR
ncbi:MAG: DUF456 domain-containing protein, partial [Thermoleophilia bacterium]|nr:DUF456 domain-containing protein [Thermoleophilia bacterium]